MHKVPHSSTTVSDRWKDKNQGAVSILSRSVTLTWCWSFSETQKGNLGLREEYCSKGLWGRREKDRMKRHWDSVVSPKTSTKGDEGLRSSSPLIPQ